MDSTRLHECKIPISTEFDDDPREIWGGAIGKCTEYADGTLWVDNGEYGSQVNFCPFCGYEAKVKIT